MNTNQQEQPMFFRQGDILFQRVSDLPKDVNQIPNSLTVALREITGHHHSFKTQSQVLLYKTNGSSQDPTAVQVLEKEGAVLEHQEHLPLVLPEGVYEVKREQEWNPFTQAIQRTAD